MITIILLQGEWLFTQKKGKERTLLHLLLAIWHVCGVPRWLPSPTFYLSSFQNLNVAWYKFPSTPLITSVLKVEYMTMLIEKMFDKTDLFFVAKVAFIISCICEVY